MVFHFLAGLLSLLTSALVYIIGVIVFSKDLVMVVTFILALIVLTILVGILRVLFSPSGRGMISSLHGMRAHGYSLRGMMLKFRKSMEREVISGSVARVIAFGTILFLFTNNIFVVYACLVLSAGAGLILMLAHRHHFVDLVSGAFIGCAIGLLSWKFTPLLMTMLGF